MMKLTNNSFIKPVIEALDHPFFDASQGESDLSGINPFHKLGIGPQILKRLNPKKLPEFLKDYIKLLRKYFHPDLYTDPEEKQANEIVFTQLSSVFDSLDSTFNRDKAFSELVDKSYEGRLVNELTLYKQKYKKQQEELDKYKKALEKLGYRLEGTTVYKIRK